MTEKLNHYPASAQDKMNFISRSTADQQLRVVINFAGRIDETVLARAVRLTMEREPVLGCRFVEKSSEVYWERRNDLDQLVQVQVITCERTQAALMDFLAQPTDPRREALLQARIFRGLSSDTLAIKVDHVAADGTGSKEAAYLLADTYTRLLADPGYHPAPGKFNLRGQAAFFRQAGLKNLIKYRPRQMGLPHRAAFSLPFHSLRNDERSFSLRTLEPERVRTLKAYGKSHGATLNDLILTAFYRALFAGANPQAGQAYSIQVPIDLRRSLPEGQEQHICNLSGGLFPAVTFTPGEHFEDTLATVQAAMKRWKSGQPGLTGAMLMELAFVLGYAKGKAQVLRMTAPNGDHVSPLLMSNLGMLDASRLVFGALLIETAYELGPVMLNHGLMLTASTYNDRLVLGMGTCRSNLSAEIVEGLLEAVSCELEGRI
jgi:NRPS condensation-like uncharacterized protein